MARTLQQHGEMWIALEVGCSRATVRSRIAALGLAAQSPGRRRGVRLDSLLPPERRALTETLISVRTVAYHEATLAGDTNAQLDAAISAASAWNLLVDQLRVRRTA